jgi:hypothetical protein
MATGETDGRMCAPEDSITTRMGPEQRLTQRGCLAITVDGSGLGWDTYAFRPETDFGDKPHV